VQQRGAGPNIIEALSKPHLVERHVKYRTTDAPSLQVEAEDADAVIVTADDSELAVALDLLGEVIERAQPFWGQGRPQLTYHDGKWEIWPDIMDPYAFIYDPVEKTFSRIRK